MTAPNSSAVPLKIVVVGHVDHGKSTMIGRLLYDFGVLNDKQVARLKESSERRGMPMEWSFALDALQVERDQAVTIDTTQISLQTKTRPVTVIDAPGHREFLRNMISGAASAEAALLVVDAMEGVQDQTRRHGYLLHLLGISQIVIVINKMDLAGFSETRFRDLSAQVAACLAEIDIEPIHVIPISARMGDNVACSSARTPWYDGPTVVDVLDRFEIRSSASNRPLRLPIQDVYKFDERRIIAGRIDSGVLRV